MLEQDFKSILLRYLSHGVTITSSGTTGAPKSIFRSPKNLSICIEAALRSQEIKKSSSIYTVTRMTHAGGLLAQTLPAVSIGANVKIDTFNPFGFLQEFQNHTHTFLPPNCMEILSKTKLFEKFDFQRKRILTGSDPINLDVIAKFLERNAIVQPNWGMSEIGPITIYSTIKSLEDIARFKLDSVDGLSLMGDTFNTEFKIENNELFVNSPLCVYDGWFATGDSVIMKESGLYYKGRIK